MSGPVPTYRSMRVAPEGRLLMKLRGLVFAPPQTQPAPLQGADRGNRYFLACETIIVMRLPSMAGGRSIFTVSPNSVMIA